MVPKGKTDWRIVWKIRVEMENGKEICGKKS
jgi:hypothetical protein